MKNSPPSQSWTLVSSHAWFDSTTVSETSGISQVSLPFTLRVLISCLSLLFLRVIEATRERDTTFEWEARNSRLVHSCSVIDFVSLPLLKGRERQKTQNLSSGRIDTVSRDFSSKTSYFLETCVLLCDSRTVVHPTSSSILLAKTVTSSSARETNPSDMR